MNLSNKQKALLATVGVFALSVVLGLGIDFVARNVSVETVGYACAGLCLGFLFYAMYQVMLARFDYEDTVKRVVDSK